MHFEPNHSPFTPQQLNSLLMNWRIFIWPLQPPGVILILVYALLGGLMLFFIDLVRANTIATYVVASFGTVAWYALFGSLVNYAQKTLNHISRGLFGEPLDDETNLNPFQSALAFRGTITLIVPFATWIAAGREPSVLEMLIPALFFPLFWLNVALNGSLFGSFHPKRIYQLVTGLGGQYLLIVLLVSGGAGYFAYVTLWQHNIILLFLAAYAFLLSSMLAGQLLFMRRNHLDLHTEKSPEQERGHDELARVDEINRLFNELHRLCVSGNLTKANDRLTAYIGSNTHELDPVIHQRLLEFHDKRLTLEHAARYMQRLADRGEKKKAWALLKECLSRDRQFRPHSDQALLDLTRAAEKDDAAIVNQVLANFAETYPHSKQIPDALFRRARVVTELLGDATNGRQLLQDISQAYPQFADTDEFQRYAKRLNLS